MRETQFFGLSGSAISWLDTYADKIKYLVVTSKTNLNSLSTTTETKIESEFKHSTIEIPFPDVVGMFGEKVHELQTYIVSDKDGKDNIVEEYVQACPWSSGPCIFLALRWLVSKELIEESLWEQETIDHA
jgi:hypothetical protein